MLSLAICAAAKANDTVPRGAVAVMVDAPVAEIPALTVPPHIRITIERVATA